MAYAALAMPLDALRAAAEGFPGATWWIQESKFFGAVLMGALAAWACARSPVEGEG